MTKKKIIFDFVVVRGIKQENISSIRFWNLLFGFELLITCFNGPKRLAVRILIRKLRTIKIVQIILIKSGKQKNKINSKGGYIVDRK